MNRVCRSGRLLVVVACLEMFAGQGWVAAQTKKKPPAVPPKPPAASPSPVSSTATKSKQPAASSTAEPEITNVVLGTGQRVLVRPTVEDDLAALSGPAEVVVAKVHCTFDHGPQKELFVVLPDGRLENVLQCDATETDRPFQPVTKDELGKRLTNTSAFRSFKYKQTGHFLYVYNSSEQFYQGTSRILETMYPGVLSYCKKRQKLTVQAAELPLVVLMFRTQNEFNEYRKMPEGVVAYYDQLTNWVVMYELSSLAMVAPEIALKQAISTISHEGVHQILMNTGVQHRLARWPMWISEGLPEYFSPTEVSKEIRWKGVGVVNDLRMWELERYFRSENVTAGSGGTIHATAMAPNLTSTGYASAWGLTHFVSQKRPAQFLEFIQEVSQRKPLERSSPERDEELFIKHFGSDFDTLETAVIKHLKALPYVNPMQALNRRLGL